MSWLRSVLVEFGSHFTHGFDRVRTAWNQGSPLQRKFTRLTLAGSALVLTAAIVIVSRVGIPPLAPPSEVPVRLPPAPQQSARPLHLPVREIPNRFPAGTKMPPKREGTISISIHHVEFNPERDLVRVEDDRVWWESEHDWGDSEDDHLVHRVLEEPLRRVIELVTQEGGTLKVQDIYREKGIHSARSLHKQGRAVDLTCDELGLERVAKLAWAAGFDWVYYEAPKKGGHHVHASVKPD